MTQKTFKLPTHPTRGKQQIVIEKSTSSVWYLVVTAEKAIPLSALKKIPTAADVLEALQNQCGTDGLMDFMSQGYSK
ncbi:hypothetical protein DRH27_01315 [Candidatus Falkowbacteria bacterium]|nr:MAG: hypothetical protein DRH27_01315 [Candidatus Falkowbacteria bacterium]